MFARTLGFLALALSLATYAAPASAKMVEVVGIGVNVDLKDSHLMVVGLIKDAPAEKSGLVKANDEILAVQAAPNAPFQSVAGKKIEEVGAMIRGPEGVAVGMKLKRAGSPELTVSVVRAKFMVDDGT